MFPARIPVLTYHAVNVIQNTYEHNDHIALASDLRTLTQLGWRVVPLRNVVMCHQGDSAALGAEKVVALSCDDGSWFDFYDLEHPDCGLQRSFLNILRDFASEKGPAAQPELHMTSFVISSPDARDELDRKGLVGKRWWGDDWWREAEASGLMDIGCHSWDHVHPDLGQVAQKDQIKGDFSRIDSFEDCEVQVRKAGDYIAETLGGKRPSLFAYPWGEASDYLCDQYFPDFREQHGFLAAFSTEPRPVESSDSKWALPRFVFGRDWNTPLALKELLAACS